MPDGRFRIIQPPVPAAIILADKGQAREASVAELSFPNGIALRPDGTMVVAETVGRRLSIFDRATDGSLTNRRTLAEVDGCPDGIAVDAEGSIWFADPERCGCYRIDPDGREAEHIPTGQACFTCALGGPDGRTLYMVLGERLLAEEALRKRPGHVVATQIAVPAFV
jgi:sugar lactone lactonase YvrE